MDDYSSRIEHAFEQVDWDWTALRAKVEPILIGVATGAGEDALKDLDVFSPEVLDKMRRYAKEFAVERAAEMVGMELRGELLLPNPDPEWTIADATRDMIRTTVTEALSEGLSAQETAKAIRESEGFSAGRAETIARTEIAIADTQGTLQGWKASDLVGAKQWLAAPDCCDECQDLDGEEVALDDDFEDGDPPLHPNCVPGESLVTPGGRISGVSQRWYDGNLVVIHTASGKRLSCTPNHPVLTPGGWVAAGLLNVGGKIVGSRIGDRIAGQGGDNENVPTRIEDVAEAFRRSEQVAAVPVPVAPEHFHGDGEGSKIAIIWANRLLLNGPDASACKKCGKQLFVIGDVQPLPHDGVSAADLLVETVDSAPNSIVSRASIGLSLGGGERSHFEGVGLALGSTPNTVFVEHAGDSSARDADELSDRILGNAALIELDDIVGVCVVNFSGHVYNLHTEHGFYVADGIVTHNCRCTVIAVLNDELPEHGAEEE